MKTYDDVRDAFDKGTVIDASKGDLEQLLIAVGQARVLDPANQARAAEMGETMRQLLAARQSQAMHSQVLNTSKLALWVSALALLVSIIQALASLNVVSPLKNSAVILSEKSQEEITSSSTPSKPAAHQ